MSCIPKKTVFCLRQILRWVIVIFLTQKQSACVYGTCQRDTAHLFTERDLCFWYLPGLFNRTEADNKCSLTQNGHLASLYDSATALFVVNSVFGGGCVGSWTGMNDFNKENEWSTWDGDALLWTNWSVQRTFPSGKGNCVELDDSCAWKDKNCMTTMRGALCESTAHVTSPETFPPTTVKTSSGVRTTDRPVGISIFTSESSLQPKTGSIDLTTSIMSSDHTSSNDLVASSTAAVRYTDLLANISAAVIRTAESTSFISMGVTKGRTERTEDTANSATNTHEASDEVSVSVMKATSAEGSPATESQTKSQPPPSTEINAGYTATGHQVIIGRRPICPRILCSNLTLNRKHTKALTLDKRGLKTFQRTLNSQDDDRISSRIMGQFGVAIIVSIAAVFVLFDVTSFIRRRWQMKGVSPMEGVQRKASEITSTPCFQMQMRQFSGSSNL